LIDVLQRKRIFWRKELLKPPFDSPVIQFDVAQIMHFDGLKCSA
jgi:hypothetical protein